MELSEVRHIPTRNLIKKVEGMSLKFHKLGNLFYTLAESLKLEYKHGKTPKEIKAILKGFDFGKLSKEIKFSDFKKQK